MDLTVTVVLFALICLSDVGQQTQAGLVTLRDSDIDQWVEKISKDLTDFRTKLGATKIEKAFVDRRVTSRVQTETDAGQLLQSVRRRIENLLWKSENNVKNIRIQAEKSYAKYSPQNYSCSDFTAHPYLRAAAILKKVSPEVGATETAKTTAAPAAPAAPGSVDYCVEEATLELSPDPRLYDVETNRKNSTSHVPPNIYDASNEILNVANWTGSLDDVFIANAQKDSTLKWQYFGTTEGMFKIYPGIQWYVQTRNYTQNDMPIDMFDCRTQYWYLLAATYPQDMVILIDNSGSMKGSSSIMANKTLTEILHTLNVNDFFNVVMFMNMSIKYVSNAFNRTMLQATEMNKNTIMELISNDEKKKESERQFSPQGVSDFRLALVEAFELLRMAKNQSASASAGGVQTIMLITDSAPEDFADLFQKYNPDQQIRLFTFLIGQEATDEETVKAMACRNRGYFVQIATLADVKENVQRYVPVLARTNALLRDYFFVWTGVHQNQIKTQNPEAPPAHMSAVPQEAQTGGFTAFPPLTPTTAAARAAAANASVLPSPISTPQPPGKQQQQLRLKGDIPQHQRKEEDPRVKNKLFASVAQAAYDIRNQTVSDGLGHLIGVAGLDVPVNQFERLGPAWELGLMAYIFMATNNGFILFHPEFRPVNEAGEMQMFYNNQDIADVEVPADGTPTNGRPSYDLSLRSAMIQRVTGFIDMVKVKTFDDMSRGTKQKFRYFHAPLNSTAPFGVATETRPTPFSLGLALPWGSAGQWPPVAAYPTAPPFDSHSLHRENLAKLFSKRLINSTCDAAKPELYKTGLAEFEFCDFSSELLAEYGVNPLCALGSVLEMPLARQQAMGCSFEYLKRVMVDALSTREAYEWETNWNTIVPAQIGATLLFLWTGTGLARWQTPPTNDAQSVIDASFAAARRNGSRDSLYERTALLASSSDSSLTVLTAPSGDSVFARFKANTSVPIYLTSALRVESSVVGVVGAEINYDRLANYFVNATNSCVSGVGGGACVTCAQTNVRCYLLDDSGAVVVSESQTDVGKTFDIVNCPAMQLMINRSLFVTVKAFDFQAVCLKKTPVDSSASTLFNPIRALMRLASWAFIEGFLLLADLTSSTLRVIKAGAQEFGMASSRSTAEDCHRVDASRPDSILKVYERVDAMIAETADLVAPHPDASLKVQEIRRRLMQPLCIGRTADDRDEEEACEYLCKRLPEQFGIGLVSDLLAGCPKFDEAQIDCTVKRTLLRREPRQPLPTSAMRLQCPLLGLCEACQPEANGSSEFNVYVRQVSGTNLMFVAVTGDPNCDCTGCPLAVITEKLSGTRNISVQQRFRERPPWSRPNVVLIDNSTVCSKTAVPSLTILQSQRWLLSFLVLLNLLVFSSDF